MRATGRSCGLLAAAVLALLVIGPSLLGEVDRSVLRTAPAAGLDPAAPPATSSGPPAPPDATARLQAPLDVLLPASGGDGDSWQDTAGREFRLGLVNAPETDECFGSQATQERQALTAGGFSADVYAQDRYGRSVAVVRTTDGVDLNVHLARGGFADDRYLAQFRDEHPQLAARLDTAFAAARAERRGLWGACPDRQRPPVPASPAGPAGSEAAAASPADTGRCHPDYTTCVAVQGNGSGVGRANDLDCGSVSGAVRVRQNGVDPYRLDGNGDGIGCDSSRTTARR